MVVDQAVSLVLKHWEIAVGLFAFGLLAFWWLTERQEADDAAETVERVGQRAETVTGGLVGSFGSLMVVLASIGVTIGNELLQTGAMLNDILGGAPVLVGHLIWGGIVFLGLQGYLGGITVMQLGYAFFTITVVALLLRYGSVGEAG